MGEISADAPLKEHETDTDPAGETQNASLGPWRSGLAAYDASPHSVALRRKVNVMLRLSMVWLT